MKIVAMVVLLVVAWVLAGRLTAQGPRAKKDLRP
jgi:hypothetical protein